MMCRPGAANTWGIDCSVYAQIQDADAGFSAFRLVQVGVNSGNTHNLCISNFEIYGKPTNREAWEL